MTLAACCCAALLTACAGSGAGPAHPDGWTLQGQGATAYWTDPQHPQERYSATRAANANGTLSDLASQVATNTLLRHRGAKLTKAVPFSACPGEAGLQTFTLPTPQGPAVLQVAFSQWSGAAITASYRRPAKAPDDKRALDAMRRSVCTVP